MRRFILVAAIGLTAGISLFAQQVLASTSWAAAFALLAGASEVEVLAPYDFTHPPEYELRPSDIRRVAEADLVIYAGYETMAPRLVEAVGNSNTQVLQIVTAHAWPVLSQSVTKIAQAIGTEDLAQSRLLALRAYLDDWAAANVTAGIDTIPVVAHFHQQALAREAGLNVVGVFGPGPLEAGQIKSLAEQNPGIIIDNGHNLVGSPLVESTDATLVVWYNFPGIAGTRELQEIFELNRAALTAALR